MKFSLLISLYLITILMVGCTKGGSSNQNNYKSPETVENDKTEGLIVPTVIDQFSSGKVMELGDRIIQYFVDDAGYKISSYKTVIDTSITSAYEKIRIAINTDSYKTNGIISYDIYTFPSVNGATDFFNDLKTQEMILHFGLNKRPNHILLDSNKVFWHHLEHPYGHRVQDLTQIFNEVFDFRPRASNLDSVSGFTYCQCRNEDATLDGIIGRWQASRKVRVLEMDDSSRRLSPKNWGHYKEQMEVVITEHTITINRINDSIRVMSSADLPDSRYFWKYYYMDENPYATTPEMKVYLKKLQKFKSRLTQYQLKSTNNSYFSIVRLETGMAYIVLGNRLYELVKS